MSETTSISELLRTTTKNSNELFMQIADYIEKLEADIIVLEKKLQELGDEHNGS